MKLAVAALVLLASCGAPTMQDSLGSSCTNLGTVRYEMISKMFHDDYALTTRDCTFELKNLDTGCERKGSFTQKHNDKTGIYGVALSVTEKSNCSDSFSDEQQCAYTAFVGENRRHLSCMGLGIDADFNILN